MRQLSRVHVSEDSIRKEREFWRSKYMEKCKELNECKIDLIKAKMAIREYEIQINN